MRTVKEPIGSVIERSSLGSRRVRTLAGNAPRGAVAAVLERISSSTQQNARGTDRPRIYTNQSSISSDASQKETMAMSDRRAGPRQGPYVDNEPRTRNKDGSWRKKRSDAGRPRPSSRATKRK